MHRLVCQAPGAFPAGREAGHTPHGRPGTGRTSHGPPGAGRTPHGQPGAGRTPHEPPSTGHTPRRPPSTGYMPRRRQTLGALPTGHKTLGALLSSHQARGTLLTSCEALGTSPITSYPLVDSKTQGGTPHGQHGTGHFLTRWHGTGHSPPPPPPCRLTGLGSRSATHHTAPQTQLKPGSPLLSSCRRAFGQGSTLLHTANPPPILHCQHPPALWHTRQDTNRLLVGHSTGPPCFAQHCPLMHLLRWRRPLTHHLHSSWPPASPPFRANLSKPRRWNLWR